MSVMTLTLKVAEGRPHDAGRGLARLDPADLARLSATPGTIIQVAAKRVAAVKAMPSFRDLRGRQLVQIDGLTRSNAGAAIGEKVTLSVVAPVVAERVVLAPEGAQVLRHLSNESVSRALSDVPVVAGDRVRVSAFGSRFQELRVLETVPKGIVIIRPDTAVRLEAAGASPTAGRLSYEDIGGLGSAIQRVREMVELPLRYPQVFARLGIDPPKGVLLHGPPGCGKTLLARAVASETEATFLSVSGPEIITKFYGESEAKLRQVFEQAKRDAPSIVFLDEIDSIASKREQSHGDVEKRVVAQLLALMDGLEARGQIIVIGATNLPNALDPALRRPGRFDREIVIGIPDAAGRHDMLAIHTRGMPLTPDVNIGELAAVTHGFTGADIAALCREAAMAALRRVLPGTDGEWSSPYEELLRIDVSMEDFVSALREVEPSALREVLVEVPDIDWDDVGGLDSVKRELREAVEWPLQHGALFRQAGLHPPKGVLLHGPPGTGKTLLAKAAAKQSGANFISVKGPELLSKYVGESEKGVREIFRKARQAAPCIVFFDEIDALAPRRSADGDGHHVAERVVAQLLAEMDGIEDLAGVLILGATNRADMLDPALLRPGRFDRIIAIAPPTDDERLAILRVHARGLPLASDIDLVDIARRTEGLSGADLKQLLHDATLCALRETLSREATSESAKTNSDNQVTVEKEHIASALRARKK